MTMLTNTGREKKRMITTAAATGGSDFILFHIVLATVMLNKVRSA